MVRVEGFRLQGLGLMVQVLCSGLKVEGFRVMLLGVMGMASRVKESGFRLLGLGILVYYLVIHD